MGLNYIILKHQLQFSFIFKPSAHWIGIYLSIYPVKGGGSSKDLLARESHTELAKNLRSKRVKIRHWARLKWLRGWDIRIKASAVDSCTSEIALAVWTLFICLPLPSSLIMFGVLYIFMFILTKRNKKGNDASAISRMPTNLHEKRISLWWWAFTMSNNSPQLLLIPSLQFISILSHHGNNTKYH